MRIKNITVRFDADERVELKREDLERSDEPSLKQLADTDKPGASPVADNDGWVTSKEVRGKSGLNVKTHFEYQDMRELARRQRHAGRSIVDLRAAGHVSTEPAPPALQAPAGGLDQLPRSAFVPLAEYLATRFAPAASYQAQYGEPGDRVYHFAGDDVVAQYSLHEIKAALAVLTAREGGIEFGLAKDKHGSHHFVLGIADKVELDADVTGFDLLFHTHPNEGSRAALPSRGDLYMALAHDPDHRGGAVTEDGWSCDYESSDTGQTRSEPARLWKAGRFPLAEEVVAPQTSDSFAALDKSVGDLRAFAGATYQGQLHAVLFDEVQRAILKGLPELSTELSTAIRAAPDLRILGRTLAMSGRRPEMAQVLSEWCSPPLGQLFAEFAARPDLLMLFGRLAELNVSFEGAAETAQLGAQDSCTLAVGSLQHTFKVGAPLANKLNTASATRRAVSLMLDETGHCQYPYSHSPTLNPEFFAPNRLGYMELKAEQSASAAVRDLVEHPELAGFECAMAMTVVHHIAAYIQYRDRFGDDADARFDADFQKMKIGPQDWTDKIDFHSADNAPGVPAFPGDHRYFENPGVDPVGFSRGRQGENVILFDFGESTGGAVCAPGAARYFGHPFGLATAAEISASLEGERFNLDLGRGQNQPALHRAVEDLRGLAGSDATLIGNLETIDDRLVQSADKRRSFDARRNELMTELNNATWYASSLERMWRNGDPRTEIDVQRYEAALEKIKRFGQEINDGDKEIDQYDLHTTQLVQQASENAQQALEQVSPEDRAQSGALTKVLDALAALAPRPVQLTPSVRTMYLPEQP